MLIRRQSMITQEIRKKTIELIQKGTPRKKVLKEMHLTTAMYEIIKSDAGISHPLHSKRWTQEEDSKLIELWDQEKPASTIAKLLTEALGRDVSRNAVIGRSKRIGLEARKPEEATKNNNLLKKIVAKVAKDKSTKKSPPNPAYFGVNHLKLRNNKVFIDTISNLGQPGMDGKCRWPVGELDSPDFNFCLVSCHVGQVYCPEHIERNRPSEKYKFWGY